MSIHPAQELHGRSAEESILLNTYFESLSLSSNAHPAIIILRGESGVGKTELARTIRPHVEGDDGFFVDGKFDRLSYSSSAARPYAVFSSAFAEYCSALETRDEITRREVSSVLQKELSPDEVNILTDAIPSLQTILEMDFGRTKLDHKCRENVDEDVTSSENENRTGNRLKFVIKKVMAAICNGDPICFLLDDVQWASQSDLELLKMLIKSAKNPCMFILTRRSQEPSHLFNSIIGDVCATEISLCSLRRDAVRNLIASTLSTPSRCLKEADELTAFVSSTTGGNPFFIRQAVLTLLEKGLLLFNEESSSWDVNMVAIKDTNINNDVVALLLDKMARLPELTQSTLKICACIGTDTDFLLLGVLLKRLHFDDDNDYLATEYEDVARNALVLALDEGLLVEHKDGRASFLHDRIQESAYSLIEDDAKGAYHLQIGRILLQAGKNLRVPNRSVHSRSRKRPSWPPGSMEDGVHNRYLFTIAVQFARGYKSITLPSEKISAARIFVAAGHRSQDALASKDFYTRARDLLDISWWKEEFNLCVDISMSSAENAAVLGLVDEMKANLSVIHEYCRGEKALVLRAYLIEIKSLYARDMSKEAYEIGMRGLELCGIRIPRNVFMPKIIAGLARTRTMMKKYDHESVLKMPVVEDEETIVKLQIIAQMAFISVDVNRKVLPFMCIIALRLSMREGISEVTPTALAIYASLLIKLGFAIKEGAQLATLALEVQALHRYESSVANVAILSYGTIFGFMKPLEDCVKPLGDAVRIGLRVGDMTHAASCCNIYLLFRFFSGQHLSYLATALPKLDADMKEFNLTRTLVVIEAFQSMVSILTGKTPCVSFAGTEDHLTYQTGDIVNQLINFGQLFIAYLFGDLEVALGLSSMAVNLGSFREVLGGTIFPYICEFYRSMTQMSILHLQPCKKGLSMVKKSIKVLRSGRKKSPGNLSHHVCLLEAEYAFAQRNFDSAERLYLEAIHHATGVIHEYALGCERLGWFYIQRANRESAQEQLEKARLLYLKWGAKAKAEHLEKKYSQQITKGFTTVTEIDPTFQHMVLLVCDHHQPPNSFPY